MRSVPGRLPVALGVWLGLFAIWLTWAPFEFRGERSALQFALRPDAETLGHFFLLMPFGVLAAAYFRSEQGRWGWRSAAAIGAFGLVCELGQGWVDGRSLSIHDLLIGYLGAVVAMGVTERFLRRGVTADSVSRALAAAAILLVWSVNVHGIVQQNRGLRILGWTEAFPVVAAQEVGGLRVYEGTVEDARICAGSELKSCVGPDADIADRARVARAAMDSRRVRLTARVVASTDAQEGPARIVTFSDGPYLRNVTLAQRKRNLVLRVRTQRSGPNGTEMEFVLGDAVDAGQATTVFAEFHAGVVTIRAESDERASLGTYRPPFRNTLRTYGSARPRVPLMLKGRGALVGVIVQFLGLGLGLGYLVSSPSRRLLLAPALACLVLSVLDAGLGYSLNPTPMDYLTVAAASTLGAWSRMGVFRPGSA